MKHYLVEIVIVNGVESRAIFLKDTKDEALKSFHNTLAYNIELDGCERVIAIILDEQGFVVRREMWEAEVEE